MLYNKTKGIVDISLMFHAFLHAFVYIFSCEFKKLHTRNAKVSPVAEGLNNEKSLRSGLKSWRQTSPNQLFKWNSLKARNQKVTDTHKKRLCTQKANFPISQLEDPYTCTCWVIWLTVIGLVQIGGKKGQKLGQNSLSVNCIQILLRIICALWKTMLRWKLFCYLTNSHF